MPTERAKSLPATILRWFALTIGMLIFLMLFFLGFLMLSVTFCKAQTSKDYSIYWAKDLNYETTDSIALSLVSQMTLEEKLDQMSGEASLFEFLRAGVSILFFKRFPLFYSGENERLHIPPFTFTDGPRGVTVAEGTTFPVAMARGATWDKALEQRVGNAIGTEVRAAGANYFGGVCINLLRHPAWGRAQETFGEDPWHVGHMGIALIQGVQSNNVMACAKHFALNSIEVSRFNVNVTADERTLREVYLPQFEMAVKKADVASIMSAYNKVRDEFCGENEYLLTNILRDDWHFKGFVSSDWVWGLHNAAKGINAGLDVEMPMQVRYSNKEIQNLLDANTISMAQIDEMVRRIIRTKLIYVTKRDKPEYSEALLASEAHQQLALDVAEKSMVLLKNDNNFLPLSADKIKTMAVIGPLAAKENIGDNGSSHTNPPHVVTIMEGLQQFSNGTFRVIYNDGSNISSARDVASSADVVLYVVGFEAGDEGEFTTPKNTNQKYKHTWGKGGDRPDLFLKPADQQLLNHLLPVNKNSVVTLIGGSCIMTNGWDQQTNSILMAWYPGMMGGKALANILFGVANPSGKLPFTIPTEERHLPYFRADIDSIHYGYYHGYTMLDKNNIKPAYAFGFGLSYTTFTFSTIQLDRNQMGLKDTINISVDVSNTGNVSGETVIQLYIGFQHSKVDRPVKLLRGFEKTVIKPGETKIISIAVAAQDLAWYNPDSRQWIVDAMQYEVYIGSSSADSDLLKSSFIVLD